MVDRVGNKKTVLITGASGAIGGEISKYFAERNYNVVLHCNSHPEKLEKIKNIINKFNVQQLILKSNITNESEVKEMFSNIEKEFSRLDVLVNNVGIHIDGLVWKLPLGDWKKVIDVNLTGSFLCSKYATPIMKKEKFGRIINLSSVVGQRGEFGTSSYAASKSGLFGLTKTLAREVAKYNITVNTVVLGYFSIGMINDVPLEMQQRLLDETPMKRFGDPKELCSLVYYLSSDDAAYITGQTIGINGGYYM